MLLLNITRRAFSKLQEFIVATGKYKLPELDKADSERNIKDIPGFFNYMLEAVNPNPINKERPLLSKTDLNKLALL